MESGVAELVRDAVGASGEAVRTAEVVAAERHDDARITAVSVGLEDAADRTYYVREPNEGGAPQIWLHPDDPRLPALQAVAFPHAVTTVLGRMSLPTDLEDLELRTYRPGRRAVARVVAGGQVFWLKVVRPTRVERIVGTHRALAEHGVPVPQLLSWSPAGLIVLGAAAGMPMADAMRTVPAAEIVAAVDAARAALVSAPLEHPVRPVVRGRAAYYTGVLASISDELGARGARLTDWVEDPRRPTAPAEVSVAVHGDLHLGQMFARSADDPTVVGLIDVDTAGIGDPADDSAAFVANALTAAGLSDRADDAARVVEVARVAFRIWTAPSPEDPSLPERVRTSLVEHLLAQAAQLADHTVHPEVTSRLLATAEAVAAGRDADALGAVVSASGDESPLRSDSSSPHSGSRV